VSRLTIKAFAAGVLSALAHSPTFAVRQYDGEANIDPDTGSGASLTLNIDGASLELIDDVSSRDRQEIESIMRDQVLETSRFPSISYDSPVSATSAKRSGDNQFDIALSGNLTLHGASHRQIVNARAIVGPGSGSLRAFGEFAVRQTEYGIKLVTAAGGAIKVKDELKCTFDMVANVSSDSR
jgi:polyisoprenoid-binding protein YceI